MTGMSVLVAAPWEPAVYAERLRRVVERYERLLGFVARGEPRAQVNLLVVHPGAMLEAEHTPEVALAEHGRRARATLDALERGGILPPAPEDEAAVRAYALADLSWLVPELRLLRRLRRRHPEPAALCEAYVASARPDPLPSPSPELVAAGAAIRGAEVRRRLLPLLGVRYGRPDLPRWLLPSPEAPAKVRVADSAALVEGRPLRIEAFGRTVAVVRHRGRLFAFDDACPHRGGALGKGDIEDGKVLCPLHGWAFDLETGAYDEAPSLCVRTHRVEEQDGAVYVRLRP